MTGALNRIGEKFQFLNGKGSVATSKTYELDPNVSKFQFLNGKGSVATHPLERACVMRVWEGSFRATHLSYPGFNHFTATNPASGQIDAARETAFNQAYMAAGGPVCTEKLCT
jgi:hypothetical protein